MVEGLTYVSAPRSCIRDLLQMGAVVLPKATTTDHIQQNAELDLEISAADTAVPDAMRDTDEHVACLVWAPAYLWPESV